VAARAKSSVQEQPALDAAGVLARYQRWLARQPLARRPREAYLAQVRWFLTWLAGVRLKAEHLQRLRGGRTCRIVSVNQGPSGCPEGSS
jgi:hypothetical protein